MPFRRLRRGEAAAARRQAALTAVAALAVIAAGGMVAGCGGGGPAGFLSSEGRVAALPATSPWLSLPRTASSVPDSTQIATVRVTSPRYRSPGHLGSGT